MKKLLLILVSFCSIAFALEEAMFPFDLDNTDIEVLALLENAENTSKDSYGWCSKEKREAIIALILNAKPRICVEVGVFGGSSFLPMALALSHLQAGKAYAIDSWSNTDCIKYMPDDDLNKSWWARINLSFIEESFTQKIQSRKLKKICTVYKQDSVKAASNFKNNSIEFLHWDGNHSLKGAQKEFQAYVPKVKSGGYILVSDVMWLASNKNPIQEAVEELFKTCELIDFLEDGNVLLFQKM